MLRFLSPNFHNELRPSSEVSTRIQLTVILSATLFVMALCMLVFLSLRAQAASVNSVQNATATINSNGGTNTLTLTTSYKRCLPL